MTERLNRRALARATLARQLLLRRAETPIVEAVEHLVGLQAQTPHSWYAGLAARLAGITPADVSARLVERRLVRIALQRSTIHLVSARDALALRPLLQPAIIRATDTAFRRQLGDADPDGIAAAGRELVDAGPVTFSELGRALAARWPGLGQDTIAQTVRARVPLVQVPPRGTWGAGGPVGGPIAHASASFWLGAGAGPAAVDELVLRYLRAFGPASVKDAQVWSGLTRLREVFERLDLAVVRDADGRELYDVPDAPRPGADVPAPARYLYDYDNLNLAYADRTRFAGPELAAAKAKLDRGNGVLPGTLLIDGEIRALWTLTRARGAATLVVRPVSASWSERESAEAEAEAGELFEFMAGDLAEHRWELVRSD